MNPLKRKPLYTCILLFFIFTSSAYAQLAAWNPSGLSNYGPSPWAPATTSANISVGGLTRGTGVVATGGSPLANSWGGLNWTGGATEDATFTLTADPGYAVSISSLTLSYRRSNTGPGAGTLEYTFGSSSTTYTVITPVAFTNTISTAAMTPVNLSGIADLQNVPSGTVIKFRLHVTGGSSVGSWYISGSAGMKLGGTVTSTSTFTSAITQTAPVLCHGQAAASLSVTATGGTLPYTYSWSPAGGTSATASGLSAGVYTCLVTSASSATTMSTYTVTEPAALSATLATQSNASCFNGSNGAATFTVNGGTQPYTYTWSPSGGNAAAATNLSAGSYTLAVSDANNCALSSTVAITQPAAVTLTTTASPSVVCNGSPVTLTATGANTYTWTGGVVNGAAFTPTSSASYTVTATTAGGCTGTAVSSITVNALPVINTSVSPSGTICAGTLITLNGSGANTYAWSGGVLNGVAFAPTASASYTVTGTTVNGCTNTAVRSLTVNALPALGASTSHATLCVGQTATLTASGAMSYTWSTTQQTPAIAVSPTTTTTYTLNGTNATGCTGTLAVLQNVSLCTGLEQVQASLPGIRFYPNPNNGSFMVLSDLDVELSLVNSLGELVKEIQLNGGNDRRLRIEGLSPGIYFLVSQKGAHATTQKMVVTE